MSANGLGMYIDYEFCTGCHTCEVACKKEHNLEKGVHGIKINEVGPMKIAERKFDWFFIPAPGELCDLCEERRAAGKLPLCEQCCQAKVIKVGPIAELAEKLAGKTKAVLYSVQ